MRLGRPIFAIYISPNSPAVVFIFSCVYVSVAENTNLPGNKVNFVEVETQIEKNIDKAPCLTPGIVK